MAKNEFDITSLTPEQRDARLALDLLALAAPSEAKPPKEDPETPAALLDEMV